MTTRKRNEWLDAEESEEEDFGASDEEERKGRNAVTGRAVKRRRTDSDLSSADGSSGDDDEAETQANDQDSNLSKLLALKKALPQSRFNLAAFEDDDEDAGHLDHQEAGDDNASALPALLTSNSLRSTRDAARKTGVVYLSRVPPFMKPSTLRNLLTPHGQLGRVFLTPESASAARARASRGGNRKKSYTDGWVEFLSKRDAKQAAAMLNGRAIGGKKGGWYRDDVWTLKYLRGFKWADLTEQIGNERAERANRVRMEVARGTRESKMFVEGVERGKMLENMERRRQGKGPVDVEDDDVSHGEGNGVARADDLDETAKKSRYRSNFKQNAVRDKQSRAKAATNPPDEIKRVLSKIF